MKVAFVPEQTVCPATAAAETPFTLSVPGIEVNAVQPPELTKVLYWLLSEAPVGATTVYDEAVAPEIVLNEVPLLVLNCH